MARVCWLFVVVSGLVAGCRSEKMAFQFRPLPLVVLADTAQTTDRTKPALVVRVTRASIATAAASGERSVSRKRSAVRHPANSSAQLSTTVARRSGALTAWVRPRRTALTHVIPQATTDANSLFFLGGLALVAAGVVLGLTIGGWPGLLAGLALGLPGYLFLGRGYAGSWQSAARKRSGATTSNLGGALQILGTILVVTGIITGFLVGGWAGFGLFLLLALIGGFAAFWGSFIIDGQLS
jgi:hypothetical protein